MKNKSEKENQSINSLINFVNSKNGIIRKKVGSGKGKPSNPNQKLFEISSISLVMGWKPIVICSLEGNSLTVGDKSKKLSLDQMDNLYDYIEQENNIGAFLYIGSLFDLTIIDGNSHSYFINWNGITAEGNGGHTMPSGLNELIEYCINLVNN
jgi:hypothetical protein